VLASTGALDAYDLERNSLGDRGTSWMHEITNYRSSRATDQRQGTLSDPAVPGPSRTIEAHRSVERGPGHP